MQLERQFVIIALVGLVHSIIFIALAKKARDSKSCRTRLLWKFVILYDLLFVFGLLSLALFLPLEFLNLLSWIVYILIVSYVLSIEILGYLRFSKYDETSIQRLEVLRKNLIKMRYSFESLEDLRTAIKQDSGILAEEPIGDLLNDFVTFCDRMKNLDRNLWELTLNEITECINRINRRSKHPFPKLIDVLSLTGISFLLAQILKLLS